MTAHTCSDFSVLWTTELTPEGKKVRVRQEASTEGPSAPVPRAPFCTVCCKQWRPTATDTAFAPPFGTIRQCRCCGCLVAGGPTACVRCAKAGE